MVTIFSALPTLSSVLDLLHHLLHCDDESSGVRILKFNVKVGTQPREIVSGLRVYTAIFEHYGICKCSTYTMGSNNVQGDKCA